MVLRNVVPRQGTEIWKEDCNVSFDVRIEKCSSPTGDGNLIRNIQSVKVRIEKCSSPTGDGNECNCCVCHNKRLRNVVPRQGTEIG